MSRRSIIAERAAALAAGALLTLALPALAANELNGIRLHDAPDSTRVVLDTRQAAAYKLFQMRDPPRVVIDLTDTAALDLDMPAFDSRVVKRIRHAKRRGRDLRVVLDLEREATAKEFALSRSRPMATGW